MFKYLKHLLNIENKKYCLRINLILLLINTTYDYI